MKPHFLYDLLPAIYRQRDTEEDHSLRALMDVLQSQFDLLHADIAGMYEDWFVETCRPWVLPYLGDLVAQKPAPPAVETSRRLVANALAYRRRKGTAATLENAILDATGWPAKVTEFSRGLGRTQPLGHLQAETPGTASLREGNPQAPGGAFGTAAHTADFRTAARPGGAASVFSSGRFAPGRIGIQVWRLPVEPISGGLPRAVNAGQGRWTVHPLGLDVALYHQPGTPAQPLSSGEHIPLSLAEKTNEDRFPRIWREDRPDYAYQCRTWDLGNWKEPEDFESVARSGKAYIAVDPARGRFLLPQVLREGTSGNPWRVDFAFLGNGGLGGGGYPREPLPTMQGEKQWRARVGRSAAGGGRGFATLREALLAWQDSGQSGHILISKHHAEDFTAGNAPEIVFAPDAASLTIEAAAEVCATFQGDWQVGTPGAPGELHLTGVWLEGSLHLSGGTTLRLEHCTMLPGLGPSIATQPGGASAGGLELSHCITGALILKDDLGRISVRNSIVDGGRDDGVAIDLTPREGAGHPRAAVLSLEHATVFGTVTAAETHRVIGSIVTGPLNVGWTTARSIHYSYFPAESAVPEPYACQPAMSLSGAGTAPAARAAAIRAGTPLFTARRFGQAGYARLALRCPHEILTGAEDGDEMGAFHGAAWVARERQLQSTLDEYLPLGLTPVLFYET